MSKYFHDAQNRKYKIKIKTILPVRDNWYPACQSWKRWVKFPLKKYVSIVFTPFYIVFKKRNMKLLEIPYDDIYNWGNGNHKYFNFAWKLTEHTIIHKNKDKIMNYFSVYRNCIIYIKPINDPPNILNTTMDTYKTYISSKQYINNRRRHTV